MKNAGIDETGFPYNDDHGQELVSDNQGNIYLTGFISNNDNSPRDAKFDSIIISVAGNDSLAFLAKLSNDGDWQWVETFGGIVDHRDNAMGIDDEANLYVTGGYTDTKAFGTDTVTSNGLTDIFVVKYDSSGNFQWVQTAGSSLKDRGNDDTYSRYLTSFDISKSFTSTKEIYRVKKGDYLYRISKNYNVTVDEIKSWNKLSSDLLSIGQKLEIYNKDFDLLDGDVITFSEIPDKVLNSVTITGSVNRPGTFPLDKFPTLKILINEGANSILPRTYLGKVDVSKEIIDGSRSFVSYDLSKVLDGTLEVYLEDQDEIRVFSLEEVEGDDNVFLFGFGVEDIVSVPWKDNLNLYDFVFSNTPYNEKEFQSDFLRARVDVKRYNVETGSYYVIPLDIDVNKNFLLNKKDEIILYSKDIIDNINPTFKVSGYVVSPGDFRLDSEMSVEDAILSAGGLIDFADISRVAVYSLDTISSLRSSSLNYFDLDMNYINGKSKKSKNTYSLRNFDIISVGKDPKIKDPVNVSVIGEVNSPGTVTLEFINESVQSVINKVGGFTQNASLGGSYIVRDSLNIDFNFIKDIKKNKSFLTDNDIIVILNNKEEITISGAVNNPSKLLFNKSKAKYYLKNSGGKTKKFASNAFVIYPSGRAKKIGFLKNPKIYPGSEIFVSFKEIEEDKENGRFFDRFTTVFSVLTGALTTVVLAKQLSN